MTTAGGVPKGPKPAGTVKDSRPIKPVKPRKGKPTPKLGIPGKPKVGADGVTRYDGVKPTKPQPDPVKGPVMDIGYRPDMEGMKKGIATSKKRMGMAYGGMTKKGMAKGGMANCGASMKPAQGKGK
jgi:hypothetical protein